MESHVEKQFFESVDQLVGHKPALCEAVKAGFKACFESISSGEDIVQGALFIDGVPDFYDKHELNKPEHYAIITLTDDERAAITSIIPDFIDVYNAMNYNTNGDGASIGITISWYGEDASWDGRDPGTYSGAWGEEEVTDCEDPNEVLERDYQDCYVLGGNVFEDFPDLATDDAGNSVSEKDAMAKVRKCYDIVIKRTNQNPSKYV